MKEGQIVATKKKKTKSRFDNMVIVRVRVKKASASAKDVALSEALYAKHNIDKSWARVSKDLFKMAAVNAPVTAMRAFMREHGVPWSATSEDENGKKKQDAAWVFTGRHVKEFTDMAQELREEFEREVKVMYDNYEDVIKQAKRALGTSFNAEDFPTRDEFYSQFVWETEIEPMPDPEEVASDFRMGLPQEVVDEQIARVHRQNAVKIGNVANNLTSRLASELIGDGKKDKGLLAGVVEYKPDPNDKRKGNTYRDVRLYDNIDNLRTFAHEIDEVFKHHIIKDLCDNLDTFCEDIRPSDPEVVRTDKEARRRVVAGLKGLMTGDMPKPEPKPKKGKAAAKKKAPSKKAAPKKKGGFKNKL